MKRRGILLVETMLVLLLDGILVALALLVLQSVLRCRSDVEEEMQSRATRTRLARSFRADVHLAVDCQTLDAPQRGCGLVAENGRRIEYRFEDHLVVRMVREREKLVEQDLFQLPRNARARLELPAVTTTVVRLRVDAAESSAESNRPCSWCIEAARTVERQPIIGESQP